MHFTKVELLTLCRVYAISCTARQNKNTLADQLCSEVPNRRGMTNPELLACSLPSGPPVKRPRRDDVDKCMECRQGEVDESSEWIEYGRCSRWLHRECAEIWEENEWQSYKETNATFICHYCLTYLRRFVSLLPVDIQYGNAPGPRCDALAPVLPFLEIVDWSIIMAFCVDRNVLYDGLVLFPL